MNWVYCCIHNVYCVFAIYDACVFDTVICIDVLLTCSRMQCMWCWPMSDTCCMSLQRCYMKCTLCALTYRMTLKTVICWYVTQPCTLHSNTVCVLKCRCMTLDYTVKISCQTPSNFMSNTLRRQQTLSKLWTYCSSWCCKLFNQIQFKEKRQ